MLIEGNVIDHYILVSVQKNLNTHGLLWILCVCVCVCVYVWLGALLYMVLLFLVVVLLNVLIAQMSNSYESVVQKAKVSVTWNRANFWNDWGNPCG